MLVGADAAVKARVEAWRETLGRLARLSDITFTDTPPAKSVQLLVRGSVAALPLDRVLALARTHKVGADGAMETDCALSAEAWGAEA